jgi:hypothetical protein
MIFSSAFILPHLRWIDFSGSDMLGCVYETKSIVDDSPQSESKNEHLRRVSLAHDLHGRIQRAKRASQNADDYGIVSICAFWVGVFFLRPFFRSRQASL